jgi:hypothetical protein
MVGGGCGIMFGPMRGGFRVAGETVSCKIRGDTHARRGDTLSPTERVRYSISVGWMVGTGGPPRAGAGGTAERVALVRGG